MRPDFQRAHSQRALQSCEQSDWDLLFTLAASRQGLQREPQPLAPAQLAASFAAKVRESGIRAAVQMLDGDGKAAPTEETARK
eukprot:13126691-Alexandrium_andersonii.AAC.1